MQNVYLRRSPHLARARPGILLGTALSILRRLGGQGGGRPAHRGLAGRPCQRPLKLRPMTGVWKGGSRADGAGVARTAVTARLGSARRKQRRRRRRAQPPAAACRLCRLLRHGSVLRGAVLRALGVDGLRHRALSLRPLGLAACALHAAGVLRGLRRASSASAMSFPKVPLPAVVARCRPMRRDRRRLRLVGTVCIQIARRRPAPHQRISQNYYLWAALGGVLMAVLVMLFDWRGFEGTGAHLLSDALAGRAGRWSLRREGAAHHRVPRALAARRRDHAHLHRGLLGASCTVMTQGDPAFSAAVGARRLLRRHEPLPGDRLPHGLRDFRLGRCARVRLAVAVSFSLGRDVGLYGRGATGILKRATSAARARLS